MSCIEAREPCSVLMYVDIWSKSQEDARPPPTQWHWSLTNSAPQTSLTWTPDAVLVSTMAWIAASPEVAKDLGSDGKLNYCCFGKRFSDYLEDRFQEPHGSGNGSYIQDLSWLLVGRLRGKRPTEFPIWYDPNAEFICYRDRTTNETLPCTHQCKYGTIYSAWHRMAQDSVTGELGTKNSAVQEYAASKRRVIQAETSVS